MRNVRSSVLLLSVFLLMAGTVLAQDPGNRDTVRVAKVTTNAGQKVGVPVTIYNDEGLGGYSLGIKWNWSAARLDSISYVGTRLSSGLKKKKTIDSTLQGVLVGMYSMDLSVDTLEPGNGLVFTIWCTVPPGVPDQYVSLDSIFIPPAGPFRLSTALGVSIAPEFVKGEIKIGNPQIPPVIVLSQSSFTFSGIVGGANPPSQAQLITNGGGQALNWTATKLASWLVLTPSNGTAPSGMAVAVNTVGLAAGVYADSVSVSAPGATNTPLKFAVTVTLSAPQPTIKLTPSSFSFQAQQNGANPPGKTLNITNIGLVTLNWTATKDSAWLTLSSYSGTAPSSVTVNVNSTGLPTGVYVDSIRVCDPTATNNPQYAVVTFEISSELPMILPSPTSVFALGAATENPYPHTLLIQNSGGGVMNWHLTKNHRWMSLDLNSGTASQGSPGVVALNFDGDSLDFGEYRDTITITSTNALNSPVIVPVVFFKTTVPQTLNVSTNAVNLSEYECGSYPGMGRDSFIVNVELRLAPLEWTLAHRASWLTVSPTSGAGTTTVDLIVSTEGLTLGVYKDTLVVNAKYAINPPETVFVSFTLLATPAVKEIGLTVDSLLYIYKYNQPGLAHQDVVIYNKPGGCLNWQATSNASWLTPIPAYGTTTQTIDVRSNTVGLSLGRHDGKVTFTANGAINSPRDLKVVLLVYALGDANGDGVIDISDVVYLMDYIFSGGWAPVPVIWSGDVDCSQTVDISDVVWLMDYIFSGGLAPCLW